MAALDFPPNAGHPAAPVIGEKYPQPAVPGTPVYTWDGEKWTTIGGTIGSTGGADDPPPMDGIGSPGVSTQWAREDHTHPSDTTRQSTAFTPVGNIAATTISGAIAELDTEKVAKAGDTMTGALTISEGGIFTRGTGGGVGYDDRNTALQWVHYAAGDTFRLYNATGGDVVHVTPAGEMTIKADPTAALGVATKQYVDTKAASTRYSMASLSSLDLTVPSGAKSVRVTGAMYADSGINPLVFVSVASGVFRTTSGDYVCNGFFHDTANTPTAVINFNSSLHSGHILCGGHNNAALPALFDGVMLLTRPDTSKLLCANFIGAAAAGTGGVQHSYTQTYLAIPAAGSALSILALRIATNGAVCAAESYINVQWM